MVCCLDDIMIQHWFVLEELIIFEEELSTVGFHIITSDPKGRKKPSKELGKPIEGKVHGILNASSKICSLVVNGQSFLVTDGSLLNLF